VGSTRTHRPHRTARIEDEDDYEHADTPTRPYADTLLLPGLTSSAQRTTLIYPWTPVFFKNFAPLLMIAA
jgi:hypothetical protein